MFSVLDLIRRRYETFTPVELKIADYILNHPGKVIEMTVQEISKESGTSDAAVIRFSKRLGLTGIKSLKIELTKELQELDSHPLSRNINLSKDKESMIFQKVFQNSLRALHSNETLVDRKELIEAAVLINKAERIVLFGTGECQFICLDLQNKLLEIHQSVYVVNDLTTLRHRFKTPTSKDLLITVSTDYNPEIVKALRLVNDYPIKTLSITNDLNRIKAKSDYTILFTEEETNTELMMTSRIGLFMVLDILFLYASKYKNINVLK